MQLEKNGKKISKVSFKKEKVIIEFEDQTSLELANDTFTHFYLYEGKILDETEIKKIKEVDAISSSRKYCLNLLSRKMYTEKEIKDKLYSRKCTKKQIENIINYLKDNNFINDQKYLNLLMEEYSFKNYGKNKIIHTLEQKGFEKSLIQTIFFDEDDEEEKAKNIIVEYINKSKNKSFLKLKSDAYNFLMTNGFTSSVASKTLALVEKLASKEDDFDILLKSLEKYVIIHQVDLEDSTQKEKVIKRFMAKGFSYKDIDKCIKETLWKN